MTVGLKQSILFVVQAVPDFIVTGHQLRPKMANFIESLRNTSFVVRTLDNHSSNVSTFNLLIEKFGWPEQLFIVHLLNYSKHIDTVQLIRNIRNNLIMQRNLHFASLTLSVRNFPLIHLEDIFYGLICVKFRDHPFST